MLGFVASRRGDYERAKELAEESLALSRQAHDKVMMADALLELAANSSYLGDHARAKEIYEEGLAVCSRWVTRETRQLLAKSGLLLTARRRVQARDNVKRGSGGAVPRARVIKATSTLPSDNLGWAALLQGDHERARTSYGESLTLCKELGNRMASLRELGGDGVRLHGRGRI